MSSRSTQEVFNLMIEKGHYSIYRNRYMCNALRDALEFSDISPYEYSLARKEIDEYLLGILSLVKNQGYLPFSTLSSAILTVYPNLYSRPGHGKTMFEKNRQIYLNWADRPLFAEGERHGA